MKGIPQDDEDEECDIPDEKSDTSENVQVHNRIISRKSITNNIISRPSYDNRTMSALPIINNLAKAPSENSYKNNIISQSYSHNPLYASESSLPNFDSPIGSKYSGIPRSLERAV